MTQTTNPTTNDATRPYMGGPRCELNRYATTNGCPCLRCNNDAPPRNGLVRGLPNRREVWTRSDRDGIDWSCDASPPREPIRDLWVCSDCLFFIANGDLPDDDDAARAIVEGCERESPGVWVSDSADESNPNDCDTQEFSSSRCDCCGSDLGGSRHRCALIFS